jgi:hypothetical protein
MTFIVSLAAPTVTTPTIAIGTITSTTVQVLLTVPSTGPTGITGYVLTVALGGNRSVYQITALPYIVTGLTPSTTYSFLASGYEASQSTYSSQPSATVNATTTSATQVPSQVTWLSTPAAVNSTQINMSWNSATGANTYTIERNGSTISSGYVGTSYSDVGLIASTTYTYNVAGVNSAGTGPYSISESATTPASSGTSLLSWFTNSTGVASGQTDNTFIANNPLSAYSNTSNTSFNGSNIVALTTITGTSYQPAVQNAFCTLGTTSGGGSFLNNNEASSNSGSNFFWPIVQARDAAGIVNYIVCLFPNPAGSSGQNPWTLSANGIPNVLDPTTAVYQQLKTWALATANQLKGLNNGHFFAPPGELNEGGSLTNGANWMANGISGNTSAYTQQMFANVQSWFISAGYTKFLWVFEVNSYATPYNFGYNASITDVISLDNQPASSVDSSVYSSFMVPSGKLLGYGSFIVNAPPTATGITNTYDMGAQVLDYCITPYPKFKFCINWPQSCALNLQNNPIGFMTANGMYPASSLPATFPTAGGIAGG